MIDMEALVRSAPMTWQSFMPRPVANVTWQAACPACRQDAQWEQQRHHWHSDLRMVCTRCGVSEWMLGTPPTLQEET